MVDPQHQSDIGAAPGRRIVEVEHAAYRGGREAVLVETMVTRLEAGSWNTFKGKFVQGLDCRCTPERLEQVCQCSICDQLVCTDKHAATCGLCHRQVCLQCASVLPVEDVGHVIACTECIDRIRTGPVRRVLRTIWRLLWQ